MSGVEVRTFLRQQDGTLLPLDDVDRIERTACTHLQGSIALSVDGVEVMTPSLWDDVNWLWPSVIGAFDDCRRTGAGQIMFPSQPIRFEVEELRAWKPMLRVSVEGGDLEQRAVGDPDALYDAVGRAGLRFVDTYLRHCPAQTGEHEALAAIGSWDLGR